MRNASPALEARGLLVKAGGKRILGPVDLEIGSGESVVIIGPNGAGKTTFLRVLAGLVKPAAGTVECGGDPIASFRVKELAKRIAYVPQVRPARVPLTVETVVEQGRYAHLGPLALQLGPEDRAAVEAALAAAGVEALRERSVMELSGGERQAVYIAAALAQDSPHLLLDEPTTHLDPGHQRRVGELIRSLAGDESRTVVTASHDLQLAALVADRVVAVARGEVLFDGPPGTVLTEDNLARLFGTPFEKVSGGDRPMHLLAWGRP